MVTGYETCFMRLYVLPYRCIKSSLKEDFAILLMAQNITEGERNLTNGPITANNTHEMYKLGGRLEPFL